MSPGRAAGRGTGQARGQCGRHGNGGSCQESNGWNRWCAAPPVRRHGQGGIPAGITLVDRGAYLPGRPPRRSSTAIASRSAQFGGGTGSGGQEEHPIFISSAGSKAGTGPEALIEGGPSCPRGRRHHGIEEVSRPTGRKTTGNFAGGDLAHPRETFSRLVTMVVVATVPAGQLGLFVGADGADHGGAQAFAHWQMISPTPPAAGVDEDMCRPAARGRCAAADTGR